MEAQRCADAAKFLASAHDFLIAREAEHNLVLGLCAALRENPRLYGDEPYFVIARDQGRVLGAAMRTPPHALILTVMEDLAAVELLVDDAQEVFPGLHGVNGPTDATERFAELWSTRIGTSPRRLMEQRIYQADSVTPPDVPGSIRPYEEGDYDLVIAWLDAFVEEALNETYVDTSPDVVARRLADPGGGFVIWEDGGPVCLGGYGNETPNGVRVGPIYTPPARRRRGYGSALTAALTQLLLDRGRRFCFLFTDLANPTSNSIYQAVGYRPVLDVDQWRFD